MSTTPGMFRRPTDPPDPLPPLRAGETIADMHAEWARLHRESNEASTLADRLRNRMNSYASRLGRTDRHLWGKIVRAVDDVATRCDELAQRVNDLAVSVDDLARTVGEEVTQLRVTTESPTNSNSESSRSASS